MKFFNKEERWVVVAILGFIVIITSVNLKASIRRARDAQRRADLGAISNALHSYHQDFGFFPPASDDGMIVACPSDDFDQKIEIISQKEEYDINEYFEILVPCKWGTDGLYDLSEEKDSPYLKVLHQDPKESEGISYYYLSNTKRFQIYAYLEGEDDEEGYNQGIVLRNLPCGDNICNFGKSFGATPLEKSIQEYENELMEENLKKGK